MQFKKIIAGVRAGDGVSDVGKDWLSLRFGVCIRDTSQTQQLENWTGNLNGEEIQVVH